MNSKWIKNLNVRPETIVSLFYDINHNKVLFDPPYRGMEIKTS